jgi:hypothetical protein
MNSEGKRDPIPVCVWCGVRTDHGHNESACGSTELAAKRIGELQARVAVLEGALRKLRKCDCGMPDWPSRHSSECAITIADRAILGPSVGETPQP